MDNKLNNLRNKMNKSVFQDINFSQDLERKILNSIEGQTTQPIPLFNKRLNNILSIAVVFILFIGVTYYIKIAGNQHSGKKGTVTHHTTTKEQEAKRQTTNNSTIYIPRKQNENYNVMTKKEILEKMINSVDNFKTAKGEFKVHYGNISGGSGETVVDYELSLGDNFGGYSISTHILNGEKSTISSYYSDKKTWDLVGKSKTYIEANYQKPERQSHLSIEQAFSYLSTDYRERPPIGEASSSLFPYEIASNYTRDLTKWTIDKQNQMLLGHNTLVIKGQLNKRNMSSFRFWVDKDTGILVKYETYNSSGQIVDYLHPVKLEVNVPVDSSHFKPNLKGYTNIALVKTPGITTGNIDNLVPKSLKVPWDNAKNHPEKTTILNKDGNWYIMCKKGYLVDRIDDKGKVGILYLAKVPSQKSKYIFQSRAQGVKADSLKIVYEK